MTHPADNMPELKPCPFCGSKANERSTWMCCTNPKCHLFNSACRDPDEWNTRTPSPNQAVDGDRGRALSLWKEISESYSIEGECRVYRMDEGAFDLLNDALIKALKQ